MALPFDSQKLDRLLAEANVDLVLAVSKHNVQYLLGGYRFFFFAHADAIGTGRYLPIVGYFPGKVELGFYVGAGNEGWGLEVSDLDSERRYPFLDECRFCGQGGRIYSQIGTPLSAHCGRVVVHSC